MNLATGAKLTGRERVNRALEGRDHDRVPLTETVWPDTYRLWQTQGGPADLEALLDRIDADFNTGLWCFPRPFPGRGDRVLSEDDKTKTIVDEYGATTRVWKEKSGTPEHGGWQCDGPDSWREVFRLAFENAPPMMNLEVGLPRNRRGTELGRWRFLNGIEPFEVLRKLIGDEATMINLVEEPEWIAEVSEVSTSVLLRNFEGAIGAGMELDGIWIYGDMAFKTGTFCSPDMYREVVWPQHKRITDWAHERGLKMIFHTDGDVRRVMDDYLDAGFDALQPMEAKASMDVRELAPVYGDRLTLFGNMDVMVYAFGSEEEIREEIRTKMTAGKTTKRYIFHSDHSIPPQVSWERYEKILGFYREFAAC